MRNPFNPFSGKLAVASADAGQPPRPQVRAGGEPQSNWSLMGDDPDRTVRAGRRRRIDGDPSQRERADAPQRRDAPSSSGGSSGGGSSSGGSSGGSGWRPTSSGGGGFNIPGGTRGAAGGGMGLLIICVLIAFFLLSNRGGNDSGTTTDQGQFSQAAPTESASGQLGQLAATQAPVPTLAPVATARPRATATRAAATATSASQGSAATTGTKPGQTWTVMLYQDADDKILEEDIFVDFNEAERVGSTDRVKVVAQMDRYKGGFTGDGNWTSTRRYELTRDNDLNRINSKLISEGEVNMSSGDTLADFITWAAQNYPADKYVLILSDHGMGWPGGWSDPDAGRQGQQVDRSVPLEATIGDNLFLNEMDKALAKARQQAGINQFELIGLDACLMGHVEVMDALKTHARYAVFSQETEPALGWAYTAFLTNLAQNPDADGATLAKNIVQSYIDQDQRIVDPQARNDWIGRANPLGSGASEQQVRSQLSRDITLTAVDLSQTDNLIQNLNQFAFSLQKVDANAIAKARRYTQSFTSIFGQEVPPSYLDLGHFLVLLTQATKDQAANAAARNLAQALTQAIIAKKSGSEKPGATGLSIYFPTGQLYSNAAAGPQSYTAIANQFAQDSLWDEFLAFFYGGRTFQEETRAVTVPAQGVTRAPGTGQITLSPVQKDKSQVSIRDTVLLSTNVSGDNVGYIYFFTGFLDRQSGSVALIDRDYLEAADTKEAGGVSYPDWGQGDFKLEFGWEPLAYAITDGQTRAQAALMPESYGQSYEETVYTVDGTYTYQDGEQRYARAYFRDGLLRKVMGFNQGADNPGAPWEITPEAGDKFTVLETWLEPDGQGGVNTVQQAGQTLTFSEDQPFEWVELDAAAGEYVVGFIVADLEGNTTEAYTTVTVLP